MFYFFLSLFNLYIQMDIICEKKNVHILYIIIYICAWKIFYLDIQSLQMFLIRFNLNDSAF